MKSSARGKHNVHLFEFGVSGIQECDFQLITKIFY